MTWLTEDRRRLELFRRGDERTLVEVYEKYTPILIARLRATEGLMFGAGPFDWTDLCQETFIRAFSPRARNQYDGLRPFSAYLVAIARNILRDHRRRYRRRNALREQMTHEMDEHQQARREAEDPAATLMETQLRQTYDRLVAALKPEEQRFLKLRFIEKRTRREVSDITGLSVMKVRGCETRLKRLLYARFVAAGYDTGHLRALLLVGMW